MRAKHGNPGKASHIHPVFEQLLSRHDKERQLRQKARVIWFTGLSGSGKSTIAHHLEKELHRRGYFTMVLDGDNVRTGINSNLGFSDEDRKENIRRIAEVSKLFLNCGVIAINCFVSPTRQLRAIARKIIGSRDFIEVYVNAPLPVCEQRDVKGLYKKARKGEIKDFTGIQAPFEAPAKPDVEVRTDKLDIEQSVEKVLKFILPKIKYAGSA
ncbi:MAG TPA: adenylyl-sulfate kinase [Chitinophagales bacterium]|nr:adenylyl-sulfate kinase [Chitinophagales bacterium]